MSKLIVDATRALTCAALVILVGACAAVQGPGASGYTQDVDGTYVGSLVVDAETFEATVDLHGAGGRRVEGAFAVRAPLEIEGDVEGVVIDDLLRITLTYDSGAGGGRRCDSRIEGILTISQGGRTIEGPLAITDCGEAVAGTMSMRRSSEADRPR